MEAKRVDEFHKWGCDFYGKLVVVDYQQEVLDSPCDAYSFGQGIPMQQEARDLVDQKGYDIDEVLMDTPPFYVVRIK